mgnify:CR=1 FL=1
MSKFTPDEVAARLRAMCDQVGHPDYSLVEFVIGVQEAANALESLSPPAGMVMVSRSFLEAIPCPNKCHDGMIINTGPDPQYDSCEFCMYRDITLSARERKE